MENKKIRKVVLSVIFVLMFVFLAGLVKSQEETYCAERTLSGAWCQNVPLNEVNTNYRHERTNCESTPYCSRGTCVNTFTGECLPGPQATCNPSEGGVFYSQEKDEVAQCQVGCCLLGEEASMTERVRCDTLGKDYNVKATFRADIQDEILCSALSSPQAKGACVFETERGRDCKFTNREECLAAGREFHEGLLCTAPELGTTCTRTQRTTCVEGKNEIYYIDSCRNLANVYDANKIDDISYWSYVPGVEGVEVNQGDSRGNVDSRIYGACSYRAGSTCGPGNARYGNFICKDLGCPANSDSLTGGVRREHGEEWCSDSIESFENAKPGQLSYLLYCYNGEVQYEPCDYFRNKLCFSNKEEGTAACLINNWQECIFQNNTADCLDSSRDCEVLEGVGLFKTNFGTEKLMVDSDTGKTIKASCVPKYTPASKFWNPEGTLLDLGISGETTTSICEIASVVCYVKYTEEVVVLTDFKVEPDASCLTACEGERNPGFFDLGVKKSCRDDCTPVCLQSSFSSKNTYAKINENWAANYQNLCISLGDCGVSENYVGKEGYYSWKDLFSGEKIDFSSLINANRRR